MARRGKFGRLVADFVATVEQHGGVVDPLTVEAELQARIEAIAAQLRITTQTVLRSYIDEDWGRQMAEAMLADLKARDEAVRPSDSEHFHVRVAARLLAALGQAVLYAAANDSDEGVPGLDLRLAAEAVTGLGLAIHDSPPEHQLVSVSGEIVAWTRTTLETFHELLRCGGWTFCPCGEGHGQHETDQAVLAALGRDLLLLPATMSRTLAAPGGFEAGNPPPCGPGPGPLRDA